MTQPTLRELIDVKIESLRDLDRLSPDAISQEVVELSSLWASLSKLMVDREITYAHVLRALVETHGTVAKATLYGKTTDEYRAYREAEAYWKSVQDLIRSCKKYITLQIEQRKESGY